MYVPECPRNGLYLFQHTGIPDPANALLRTALISVTCVLVMTSVLTFIIGLFCGHCLSQRRRKSGRETVSTPSNATAHVKDLELKENVAYVTLRPK